MTKPGEPGGAFFQYEELWLDRTDNRDMNTTELILRDRMGTYYKFEVDPDYTDFEDWKRSAAKYFLVEEIMSVIKNIE